MSDGTPDPIGISDDEVFVERRALALLTSATQTYRDALNAINKTSSLVHIDISAFDDFEHDNLPSESFWEEKITYAKRGW